MGFPIIFNIHNVWTKYNITNTIIITIIIITIIIIIIIESICSSMPLRFSGPQSLVSAPKAIGQASLGVLIHSKSNKKN